MIVKNEHDIQRITSNKITSIHFIDISYHSWTSILLTFKIYKPFRNNSSQFEALINCVTSFLTTMTSSFMFISLEFLKISFNSNIMKRRFSSVLFHYRCKALVWEVICCLSLSVFCFSTCNRMYLGPMLRISALEEA